MESRQSTRFTRRSARAEDTSASYERGARPGRRKRGTIRRLGLTPAACADEARGSAPQLGRTVMDEADAPRRSTRGPWSTWSSTTSPTAGCTRCSARPGTRPVPAAALLRALGIEPGRNDRDGGPPPARPRRAGASCARRCWARPERAPRDEWDSRRIGSTKSTRRVARDPGADARQPPTRSLSGALQRGDQPVDPLVDRAERVLAQHGALGLVVELEVHPVDGEVAARRPARRR